MRKFLNRLRESAKARREAREIKAREKRQKNEMSSSNSRGAPVRSPEQIFDKAYTSRWTRTENFEYARRVAFSRASLRRSDTPLFLKEQRGFI